jgi:hypothetical protein
MTERVQSLGEHVASEPEQKSSGDASAAIAEFKNYPYVHD